MDNTQIPQNFAGLQYVLQRPSVIREVKNETMREIRQELVHKEEIRALQTQIDSLTRSLARLNSLPSRIEELEKEVQQLKQTVALRDGWEELEKTN